LLLDALAILDTDQEVTLGFTDEVGPSPSGAALFAFKAVDAVLVAWQRTIRGDRGRRRSRRQALSPARVTTALLRAAVFRIPPP
jgi:hypothetical protein